MAVIDPAIERARLDQEELAAAVLLVSKPHDRSLRSDATGAAVARLSQAGAIDSYGLIDWFARLMRIVAAPDLRAVTEVNAGDQHAIVALAWCNPSGAVLGRLAAGNETELRAIEPTMLPAAIGAEVGLTPRPSPPGRTQLRATAPEIERALAGDGDESLGRVMAARVRSWRITVSDGRQTCSLGVLDGGETGLWLSEQLDDDPECVTLTPTTAETVTNGLLALFAAQLSAV